MTLISKETKKYETFAESTFNIFRNLYLYKECKAEEDSIIIYRFDSLKYSQREILGTYEQKDNFL